MSLRVSYSNPLGYVIVTEKVTDNGETKTNKYKLDLCFANIKLFAEIEHLENESRLHIFFVDNDHLKRIVRAEGKNAKYFLKGRHYFFNSFYRVVRVPTVELLNKLGAKVSFYYKDPNKKKAKRKK